MNIEVDSMFGFLLIEIQSGSNITGFGAIEGKRLCKIFGERGTLIKWMMIICYDFRFVCIMDFEKG